MTNLLRFLIELKILNSNFSKTDDKIKSMKSVLIALLSIFFILDAVSQEEVWCYSFEEAMKSPQEVNVLEVVDERIKEFPSRFSDMSNLRYLKLFSNNLDSFPVQVVALEKLSKLVILKNQIKTLPREIGQMEKLKKLDLSDNEIEFISPEIGIFVNTNFPIL